jgi:hypothetical protein
MAKVETIKKRIPPMEKVAKRKPKQVQPATLTADELLEYKVRMVLFSTVRDAYALWVRQVKAKYKIDQTAVLDIDGETGKLYIRKPAREAVQADG